MSGLISGYASLFGRPDLSRDIVERGAFAVHTRAPSSITATAQVAAVASSSGSTAVARSRSALVTDGTGNSTPRSHSSS